MSRILPDIGLPLLKKGEKFSDIGIKINRSLEGIEPKDAGLEETIDGVRVMRSLEFDMVSDAVAKAFNQKTTEEKRNFVRDLYAVICPLKCIDCYARENTIFDGKYDLLMPDEIIGYITTAVKSLGTKTLKFMGPGEIFRDPELFTHLDKLKPLEVIVGIFAKDPMLGNDAEAKNIFGHMGIKTSEELVKKLSEYENLRILFNLRSFDEDIQNRLIGSGGMAFQGNYKQAQTRAIELLYRYFVAPQISAGRESRLVIVNAPILNATIDESLEIFTYFMDRAVPVISCASMQSGYGKNAYQSIDSEKLSDYYAAVSRYAIEKGLTTIDEIKELGPSPYAAMVDCLFSSNLFIRATGHVQRCPGVFIGWVEATHQQLEEKGIIGVWKDSKTYAMGPVLNPGCPAKPGIYNDEFAEKVIKKI